jgi:hypothetical protein
MIFGSRFLKWLARNFGDNLVGDVANAYRPYMIDIAVSHLFMDKGNESVIYSVELPFSNNNE